MTEKSNSWLEFIPATVASLFLISQIIIGFYVLADISQIELLAYIGVGIYFFSGLIFGMLPVFEFRKKGGVRKGDSYIHTTKLVDSGMYSIVRHPQYVTFILWGIAGMLLFQHWLVICLGFPIIPLIYIDLLKADRDGITKFGDEYIQYMKKVPRANFLLGIIRLFMSKR